MTDDEVPTEPPDADLPRPAATPPPPPPPPAHRLPPAPPGIFGAPPPGPPPPPGYYGGPPPGNYGTPPPPSGYDVPPPPGYGGDQYQPYQPYQQYQPAQPYQYGLGVPAGEMLAAPGKRILARILDWVFEGLIILPVAVIVILAFVDTTTSNSSFRFTAGNAATLSLNAAVALIIMLYEVGFIAVKGATPGKMIMKVRVVREADGQIPGWGPAFMRWLPELVGVLCSLLSLGLWIWALVNIFNRDNRQTPMDMAAHTLVVDA